MRPFLLRFSKLASQNWTWSFLSCTCGFLGDEDPNAIASMSLFDVMVDASHYTAPLRDRGHDPCKQQLTSFLARAPDELPYPGPVIINNVANMGWATWHVDAFLINCKFWPHIYIWVMLVPRLILLFISVHDLPKLLNLGEDGWWLELESVYHIS